MADSAELPIPAASFAQALSGKISGSDNPEITVTNCALRAQTDDERLLVFHAELAVLPSDDGSPERWLWDLPIQEVDLTLPTDSLVATVRANLEEWWFAKDSEPRSAMLGRRVQ
jgi:hypothetical protein